MSVLPILIFSSLPASGKSESRRYLKNIDAKTQAEFHMGDTKVQIDDYPYVHFMRSTDDALHAVGLPTFFFSKETDLLHDERDWGTLAKFINDDYEDIVNKAKMPEIKDSIWYNWERFDAMAAKVGIPSRFAPIKERMAKDADYAAKVNRAIDEVCEGALRKESDTLVKEKFENIPENGLEGKTIVVEFARGGPKDAGFPLPTPFGYQYSFSQLSDAILSQACALYIWVTPEMSYAKNYARSHEANPQTTSTQLSLNHGVPHNVMIQEYGCDDMEYLVSKSEVPNCVTVTQNETGKKYYLPVGMFDNREDLTTPFRGPISEWDPKAVVAMENAMKSAFGNLVGAWEKTREHNSAELKK